MEYLTPEFLATGFLWFAAFLFSVTVHEAAHALVAWRLGDSTAYEGGQVTLNPLPHIQRAPFGTIVVPIVSYAIGGWMIGWASAPYDPIWANRHPRRAAWMALAGPVSNLLIVILVGLIVRGGMLLGTLAPPTDSSPGLTDLVTAASSGPWEAAATLLSILFALNVLLLAFNLLPLPPLDGSGCLPLILPESIARKWNDTLREPGFSLIGLLVAWKIFGYLFWPVLVIALNVLYPGMGWHLS